jgi:hypothetical protein
MHADFKSYLQYFAVYQEQSTLPNDTHSFSSYAFSLYLFLVSYEFTLSLYIIQKANHPIINKYFQGFKQIVKVLGSTSAATAAYSYAPVEPSAVTNYLHTKTPLGRGVGLSDWKYGI